LRGIGNAILQSNRIAATLNTSQTASGQALREMAAERFQLLTAKVTLAVTVTADLKWKYEWEEVRFTAGTTSIATKTSGLTWTQAGYGYNWNELANAVGFWAPLGSPVNVPAGFKVKPIASGTPVLMFPVRDTTGKVFWCFDKVNAIDGECP